MIIVKFYGGLGNQMLQYASYTALRERYPETSVMADVRKYYFQDIHNGFELDRIFPVQMNLLSGKKIIKNSPVARYWHFGLHIATVKFFKLGLNNFRFIKDNNLLNTGLFHLDTSKNYYLQGYWGNEKYFTNAREQVKQHFTFKIPLDAVNESLAIKIKSQNSVSLHVRRGDYIGEGSVYVDLSRTNYYQAAFDYLTTTTTQPVFYIFSNDIKWCRTHLTWLQKYEHYFVEGNGGKDSYKDMQLMSLCKHNITANSSFSWWGGWLNSNANKVVIYPATYITDEVRNNKILLDFYPASWVKIK